MAVDKAQPVQTLAKILADPRGRVFVSRLNDKDVELCIEILDQARSRSTLALSPPQTISSGDLRVHLKPAEKQIFFVILRRLVERHEVLPNRIVVQEEIEVQDRILASGGFSDVRCGTYMGRLVAVKTARIAPRDDFQRIRKVSINVGQSGFGLNHSAPSNFAKKSSSGVCCPTRTS